MDIDNVSEVPVASSGRTVAARTMPTCTYAAKERTSSTNGRSSLISGKAIFRLYWRAPSPAEVGVEGGCVAMSGSIELNNLSRHRYKYGSGRTVWIIELRIDI